MSNRWRIKLTLKGNVKKDLRNQTGFQLRRIRNDWSRNKKNAESEYYNTQLHYEAETDLKKM